jgi:hypothetical protein
VALSKYVIALIKKDKPVEELKGLMQDQVNTHGCFQYTNAEVNFCASKKERENNFLFFCNIKNAAQHFFTIFTTSHILLPTYPQDYFLSQS